eukprot:EG_transcript_21442
MATLISVPTTAGRRSMVLSAQRWSAGGGSGSSRSRSEVLPRHIVKKQLLAAAKAKAAVRPRPKAPPRPVAPRPPPQPPLPVPPVNPVNEEFVVFVRATVLGERWLPITIMVGGPDADNLVKGSQGSTSPELYHNELLRSIGQVIYNDQGKIEAQLRQANIAGIREETSFEYGFKVRDKTKPEAWMDETGIVALPPKAELPPPTQLPPVESTAHGEPVADAAP